MTENRYIRNLGALTAEEQQALAEKKVFVAGCGGLGGNILDQLLRLGYGRIKAADGDTFEISNLNRQLMSSPEVIGRSKAKTAEEYAKRINPDVEFLAEDCFITEENVGQMISGYDAVIDALDSIPARRILKAECDRQKIPFIHGAIGAWVAQAAISMPGDGLLDMLYPNEAKTIKKSSLAFTVALCASLQVSLCTQLLCGRSLETGKVYYIDLQDMELLSFGK